MASTFLYFDRSQKWRFVVTNKKSLLFKVRNKVTLSMGVMVFFNVPNIGSLDSSDLGPSWQLRRNRRHWVIRLPY